MRTQFGNIHQRYTIMEIKSSQLSAYTKFDTPHVTREILSTFSEKYHGSPFMLTWLPITVQWILEDVEPVWQFFLPHLHFNQLPLT